MPEKRRRRNLSTEKAARQSVRRQQRNKSVTSAIKTSVTKARTATRAGDPQIATAVVRDTARLLAKAASKGILHKRTAARRKSALARALHKVSTSPAAEQTG